ncbi:hypothetical protein JCM3774_003211 [Rhodotorula dairenensis]
MDTACRLADLPDEVLERILDYAVYDLSPPAAVALALVSKRFAAFVHLRQIRLRSASAALRLEQLLTERPSAAQRVKTLVLVNDSQGTLSPLPLASRRGSRSTPASFDADMLVRLCAHLQGLGVLVLRELDLSALRRRQLGFAVQLSHLHSLVISSPSPDQQSGASARQLNLNILGRIVQDLPHLEHLAVRGIRGTSSALRGLAAPSCRLVSFGLFSTSGVTGSHLQWLLAGTTASDTLRTVAFDLGESVRPAQLSAVKWALLPVRHVYITSSNTKAIAELPHHFPSLRTYSYRTPSRFDALPELLRSLPAERRIDVFDASPDQGGFLYSRRALGWILAAVSTCEDVDQSRSCSAPSLEED